MQDDTEEPQVINLPVPLARAETPAPAALENITAAVLAALSAEDMARLTKRVLDLAEHSESDPARISAARLLFDRLVPKEDIEQKRREIEERDDAIAEARGILAEYAASRLAILSEPPSVAPLGPPGADNASDNGA